MFLFLLATLETKIITQLCLLPYIIPPKGQVRKNKGHWKPSMIESEESLVAHVKVTSYLQSYFNSDFFRFFMCSPYSYLFQVAADVSRIREERSNAMRHKQLTVQPYIIVVGPSLDVIQSFFVSVDSILNNVSSASEAIDTCFKAFHVLDAAYPRASEHLWYLIQRELYNFTTKYDRQISYILEVIASLAEIKKRESENTAD